MKSQQQSELFRLSPLEWKLWALFALVAGLLFQHGDVRNAAVSSLALFQGHVRDFYEYNNVVLKHDTLHFPPKYFVFAAWTAPLYALGWVRDIPGVERWMLYYKAWILVVFGLTAFFVHRIAGELAQFRSKKSAEEVVTYWLTHPLTFFAQVIWGGYDVIYVCILLGGLLLFLRGKFGWGVFLVGVAASFKNIALLAFLPVLLLREKRLTRLAVALALILLPQLLMKHFYRDSDFFMNGVLKWDHVTRIFGAAIFLDPLGPQNGKFAAIGWYFLSFFLCTLFGYFLPSKADAKGGRWQVYLGLCSTTAFFIFVQWHPHWLVILTPFLAWTVVEDPNRPFLHLLDLACGLFFVALATSIWLYTADIVLKWGPLSGKTGLLWAERNPQKYFRIPFAVTEQQTVMVWYSAFVTLFVGYLILLFPPLRDRLPLWEGSGWDRFNRVVFRARLYGPVVFFCLLMLYCYL